MPKLNEMRFVVDESKSKRREGSIGWRHLKKLDGKNLDELEHASWYCSYRTTRDFMDGSLKLVKVPSNKKRLQKTVKKWWK